VDNLGDPASHTLPQVTRVSAVPAVRPVPGSAHHLVTMPQPAQLSAPDEFGADHTYDPWQAPRPEWDREPTADVEDLGHHGAEGLSVQRRRGRRGPQSGVAIASAVVLLAATGACGGGDDDHLGSSVSVEEMRASVQQAAREVSGLVAGPDVELVEAVGSYSTCGTEPVARMEYGAGLGLRPRGDVLAQVREAGAALQDAGWEVTDEGDSSVNLLRGELRLSVKEARFDEGQITVEIVHDCVEAERADVPDLEPEQIDVDR
jgi:hypothetical protein